MNNKHNFRILETSFPKTTDYHWPLFSKDADSEVEFEEIEGPFGFDKGIKIRDGVSIENKVITRGKVWKL